MQEGPITEPFAQPIIAYRRLRIDVLLLCQPGERRPLIADFVDELEREALPAGEDTTVRHPFQRGIVEMAACLHHAAEPSIRVRDDCLDGGARLRRGWLKAVGRSLQGRGFDLLDLDAEGLEEVGDVWILDQHA